MIIRNEKASDVEEIAAITRAAFENHPFSRQTEPFIIAGLRAADALTVSLVAVTDDGGIVGHIAFSPAKISDGSTGWYGVGPLSVRPDFQRQGIGGSLVLRGIGRLVSLGASGCVLVGDPGYYERFGFRNPPDLTLEGVPPEVFLALPFGDARAHGTVTFHPAFGAEE